ncbi:MAG: TAT-variant-translocated molybdopterin oxidoreductase, partial [Candidatus Kapaibacterium sp.]
MSIDTEQPTPSSDPRSETNGEYGRIEIEHADAAALALPVLDADAVAAPQPEPFSLDITALRRKLAENTGKEYWRSLDELAGSRDFQDMLQKEFPDGATEWQDPVSRRGFLKLMGASLAFGGVAGIAGCTVQPDEQIVPYVKAPEQFVPGRPLFFATVAQRGGYAVGVLAESHLGRPTKIEGNPDHPSSLGAADAIMQASILNLYDPDRSQSVLRRGEISTWEAFLQMIVTEQTEWKADGGAGLRVLTETITSPTLADQIHQLLTAYPAAKWHQYEPTSRDNVREGARLAFGDVVETTYRFSGANVVVSLDADFMASMPGSLRYAREFADGRRVSSGVKKMNRLYMVETTPTVTGAMADHRRALRPAELENFAWSLAAALGVAPAGTAAATDGMIATIAKELQANRGKGIVVAGDEQAPAVHALAHAMNQALGNVGATVIYTDPVVSSPINQIASLADLAADIDAKRVTTLLVLDGNPVFNAPADLRFSERYATVRNRIHLSMYDDETSRLSQWHIPENHYLETWGDARAHDGTVSIIQPLIAPMYGGKSSHDIIAALLGQSGVSVYDLVRNYWKGSGSTASASTGSDSSVLAGKSGVAGKSGARMQGDFGKGWQKALFDGFVAGTAFAPKGLSLKGDLVASLPKPAPVVAAGGNTLDIIFRPDPSIHDGRYANNGWLQEVPKPLSKLCWDNALLIAPATAEARKLENGDMVEVKIGGYAQRVPVWITPGHAAGSGTLYFGYGRTRAGNVGTKTGFDVYAIRTSGSPWHALGATITPTDDNYELATTQEHHSMEGRGLV